MRLWAARLRAPVTPLDQSNRDCTFWEMARLAGLDDPHGYFELGPISTNLSADKVCIVEEGTRIVSRQDMLGKPSRIIGTEIRRVQ